MRSRVVVEEESDFQAWLQEQSTFAELMAAAGNGEGGEPVLASRAGEADPAALDVTRPDTRP